MRTARGVTLTTLTLLAVSCLARPVARVYQVPASVVAAGTLLSSPSPAVRAAALYHARQARAPEPPLSLTASDGTGLGLERLEAKVVLEGPLAFTELRLTFRNPQSRTMEGRFNVTLPEGAAISRFAMQIRGDWMEAEVVEKQAARETYESYLHRKQDPALLEKKAGNTFRARVFPILPRERKQLILSYSQELSSSARPYRLPLRGLPRVGRLEIAAQLERTEPAAPSSSLGGEVRSRKVVRVARRNWKPDSDFELPVSAEAGLRHGDLVLVRVKPTLPARERPIPGMLVLLDTSASRGQGLAAEVEGLQALARALVSAQGPKLRLKLACFDQQVTPIFEGPADQLGQAQVQHILARRALGASDLAGALRWAGKVQGYPRLLVITDGVVTAGATDARALRRVVSALRPRFKRMDVVLVGGIRDPTLMRRLTAGTLPEDGVVLEAGQPADELARRLALQAVSGIEVSVPGARWVWPEVLDAVQPGDEVLIHADLPRPGRVVELQLRSKAGVQLHRVTTRAAPRPLLERASVRARIERLEHLRDTGERGDAPALREKIVALSRRHRVLSDHTALLVLETEWDYRRFGIERTALADILTVGSDGVKLVQRTPRTFWSRRNSVRGRDVEQALGGLIGADDGGASAPGLLGLMASPRRGRWPWGRRPRRRVSAPDPLPAPRATTREVVRAAGKGPGAGRLAGRRARVPLVMVSRAVVMGSLDKHIIRRVIRRHINQVRNCYQRELQSHPGLAGRVTVDFVIEANGRVLRSTMAASTLDNRAAEDCVARSVLGWRFPRVAGGGIVQVRYPFAFRPVGSDAQVQLPRSTARPTIPRRTFHAPPHSKLRRIQAQLRAGKRQAALVRALRWRAREPGNVLALLALGEALQATGHGAMAARAFGSIIDLYPSRADMRRYAGERLAALGRPGLALAVDTLAVALRQRPDHAVGYRLLAHALLRRGKPAGAFRVLERGLQRRFPPNRFRGVRRVLRQDLGLAAAAWIRQEPARAAAIEQRTRNSGARVARRPSLRFVLHWETDASDVDLHVRDGRGGRASPAERYLPSGGRLLENVTTGYGPESFVIQGVPRAFPYRLFVRYASRGPMGYGMGTVQVIQHDGKGGLRYTERPFVALKDWETVALAPVRPL